MKKLALSRNSFRLVSLCLLTLISGSCVAKQKQQGKTEKVDRNTELTNAAWTEYDNKHYDLAITAAMRCVDRFKKEADADQARMEKNRVEQPPVGLTAHMSPQQEKTIYEQGVLNDVATCYWIAANSAQILGKNDEARQAYQAAAKYTYARTYDKKQKLFWSPADDAADRIKDIPETKNKN